MPVMKHSFAPTRPDYAGGDHETVSFGGDTGSGRVVAKSGPSILRHAIPD